MAPLRAFESLRVVNVSQGAVSSPTPARLQANDREKILVKDSLEDVPPAHDGPHTHPRLASAYFDDEDEDLYGISPKQGARNLALSQDKRPAVNKSPRLSGHHATEAGTAQSLDSPDSAVSRIAESLEVAKQPISGSAMTPSNLKSIAQAALSDNTQPQPRLNATSATRKTNTGNSRASNSTSLASKHLSTISQTSAMPSATRESSGRLKPVQIPALAALRAKRAAREKNTFLLDEEAGPATASLDLVPTQVSAGARVVRDPATGSAAPTRIAEKVLSRIQKAGDTTTAAGSDEPTGSLISAGKAPLNTNMQNGTQSNSPARVKTGNQLRHSRAVATGDDDSASVSHARGKQTNGKSKVKPKPSGAGGRPSRAEQNGEVEAESKSAPQRRHRIWPAIRQKLPQANKTTSSTGDAQPESIFDIIASSPEQAGPSKASKKTRKNVKKAQPVPATGPSRATRGQQAAAKRLNKAESGKAAVVDPKKVQSKAGNDKKQVLSRTMRQLAVKNKASDASRDDFGRSQDRPHIISDDCLSSSFSLKETRRKDEHLPESQSTKGSKYFQTPVVMRSSPPAFSKQLTANGIMGMHSTVPERRKDTIIAFDKFGPRNQGVLPSNTPGARSAIANRSSLPPVKSPLRLEPANMGTKLDGRGTKRPSSVDTSIRTSKSTHAARPGNVAANFADAILDLMPKRRSLLQTSTDKIEPALHSPLKAPVVQDQAQARAETFQEDSADAHMVDIEDLGGDTLVGGASPDQELLLPIAPRNQIANMRTASQIVMPPPAQGPRDRVLGPAAQPAARRRKPLSATTLEIDPARTRHSRSPDLWTERFVKPARTNGAQRGKGVTEFDLAPTTRSGQKRAAAQDLSDLSDSKRAKVAEVEKYTSNMGSNTVQARGRKTPPKQRSPSKLAVPFAWAIPSPSRQVLTGDTRHLPLGSQTVDVNGSPVPPDLDVPKLSTVLETYSKHACRSSDYEVDMQVLDAGATSQDDSPAPSSNQIPILSSNKKPLPAAPEAESRAMSRVKFDAVASDNILHANTLFKVSDPFKQSNDDVQPQYRDSDASPSTVFANQLERKRNTVHGLVRLDQLSMEARPDVYGRSVKRLACEGPPPAVLGPITQKVDNQVSNLRGLAASARAANKRERHEEEETDPDKTLVENEEITHPVSHSWKTQIEPSKSVADDPELFDLFSDDLMSWYKTKQPHQIDLFEEIVRTARRLIDHLDEQEKSISHTLQDLHERKLFVINEGMRVRAKEYEQAEASLRSAQREKQRELKSNASDLKNRVAEHRRRKQERLADVEKSEEEDRKLENLLNSL